jgi:hypothetical protein
MELFLSLIRIKGGASRGHPEVRIVSIRGRQVILDADLALLFGVPTKHLNQQYRRNRARFPEDFTFRLTPAEAALLRSQIATSKRGRGGRRYSPLAFTEHGAVMAATVLNSPRAVAMSIEVVRAFVRLRGAGLSRASLAEKLRELETLVGSRLANHDSQIAELFAAVETLIAAGSEKRSKRRRIGFVP